ncbi:hypothetical protein HOY80DRAFT_939920 [Tuber brumale]|nr:hypothetical protein HOY80DRAFT_939920 [Tuber brumale]
MLGILFVLIFVLIFAFILISYGRARYSTAPCPHKPTHNVQAKLTPPLQKSSRRPDTRPTEALKAAADLSISELTYTIATLIERYNYIADCLRAPNPRTQGLGPLGTDFTTFHVDKRLTHDMADSMIVLLRSAHRDLGREAEAVKAFWEQWVRTNGRMPRDKVTRGVEMLTEWRDRKRGGVADDARKVITEVQKYFGIDDEIAEAEGSTVEQTLAQAEVGGTGMEVHDNGSGGSRRRRAGRRKGGARGR